MIFPLRRAHISMINMMLSNPENLSSWQFIGKELGVFSLRRSEFGVGRSAFKGGGADFSYQVFAPGTEGGFYQCPQGPRGAVLLPFGQGRIPGRWREHPGEGGFGRPCRPRRQAGRPQYGRPAARDALRPVQGRETRQRQSVRRLDSQRAREVVKKELVGTASGCLSIQTATRKPYVIMAHVPGILPHHHHKSRNRAWNSFLQWGQPNPAESCMSLSTGMSSVSAKARTTAWQQFISRFSYAAYSCLSCVVISAPFSQRGVSCRRPPIRCRRCRSSRRAP